MRPELSTYLESIRSQLRLGPAEEKEILAELHNHLEELTQELRRSGVEEGEAVRLATSYLGPPAALAREIYRIHSQGGWGQALLAALPHLLVAFFFTIHLWQNLPWLALLLVAVVTVSIGGWRQGKPLWLFPWLGYSLIPLLGVCLLLLALPPWSYLALIVYVPLAGWLLFTIALQVARRDWLLGSLVLLPFVMLGNWLLALQAEVGLGEYLRLGLAQADPWIALSFVAVALTSATFVRVSQRQLRAGSLLTPALLVLVLVAFSTGSPGGFFGLSLLALVSLALLLSPALLERGSRYGEHR